MNVLVTGASTRLGRALVHALVDDPMVDDVVALALEPHAADPAVDAPGVRWVQRDLSRHRSVRTIAREGPGRLPVHAIIHLAMHRSAVASGPRIHRLNVEATRLLLRMAEDNPTISRFVFWSTGRVYRLAASTPGLLREDAALDLSGSGPQWLRDRIEADVAVCGRMGLGDVGTVVLRAADILEPGVGSQLHAYLSGRDCLRPLGFDPMIGLLSLEDAVEALRLGLHATQSGIFNIPGTETLPLSRAIAAAGARDRPVPGPLIGPYYAARAWRRGDGFRYDLNDAALHHSGLLDGERARRVLGYSPSHPVDWEGVRARRTG